MDLIVFFKLFNSFNSFSLFYFESFLCKSLNTGIRSRSFAWILPGVCLSLLPKLQLLENSSVNKLRFWQDFYSQVVDFHNLLNQPKWSSLKEQELPFFCDSSYSFILLDIRYSLKYSLLRSLDLIQLLSLKNTHLLFLLVSLLKELIN